MQDRYAGVTGDYGKFRMLCASAAKGVTPVNQARRSCAYNDAYAGNSLYGRNRESVSRRFHQLPKE